MDIDLQYTEATEGEVIANDTQQDGLLEHNAPDMIPYLKLTLPPSPRPGQFFWFSSVNGVEELEMAANIPICSPRETLVRIRHGAWVASKFADKWLRIVY